MRLNAHGALFIEYQRSARYNSGMSLPTSLAEQFLIAMPGMQDAHFARTVSLVCQHDAQGAMALVLNQDSEYTLGELFDQLDLPCQNDALRAWPVLSGGPVQAERGFILHQDGRSWDSSMHLINGMTVTTSRDILEALANGEGPGRFQVLLGYSGWSAGQLEREIAENAWLNAPSDAEIIFNVPVDMRWQAAAKVIGVDLSLISNQAGHA
jgi:putative transcriptional regulator